MAGWSRENGKSNNAVDAEQRGLISLSKITSERLKEENIPFSLQDFKILVKNGAIRASEWHHTNHNFFNETDYFDLYDISINLDKEDIEQLNRRLHEIKATKENEKIIYGEIEIIEYEERKAKRRKYFAPIKHKYLAKVEHYYNQSRTFSNITTYNNRHFRKKSSNIKVLSYYKKEDYEREVQIRVQLDIQKNKEELKKELAIEKSNYSIELKKYHERIYNDFSQKIKRVRTMKSFLKIKKMIENEIKQQKNDKIAKILYGKDIDIDDWLKLPTDKKHPAPEKIYNLKQGSGLSWTEFIAKLSEKYIK